MSKKMSSEKKRHLRARKYTRLYGILTTLVFSIYFSAGFFLHPSFLVSDIREKIRAVADIITVVARVLDPPVKPVVSGTGVCLSGGPAIVLDWADDENSTSYDITRDSLPLTTGVVTSGYTDSTVVLGQTATYVVTALGPMGPGFSDADPITVTAPTECEPDIIPSVTVQTFAGNNILGTTERHFTTDRNPRFTGVTNLPSARIDITAESDQENITATVYANTNGYFEWSYSGRLDFDTYTVTFVATDVSDSSLSASEAVKIGIEKEVIHPSNKAEITSSSIDTTEKPVQARSRINFSVILSGTELHSGDSLEATLFIGALSQDVAGRQATVSFMIVDGNGKVIDRETQDILLRQGLELRQVFKVPYGMAGHNYRLVTEIATHTYRASHEVAFQVLELPLFKLGGNTITYEQVVSQVGWVSFVSLSLFFWWLFLFLREYYLYSQSERHIDGHDLHKAGYY